MSVLRANMAEHSAEWWNWAWRDPTIRLESPEQTQKVNGIFYEEKDVHAAPWETEYAGISDTNKKNNDFKAQPQLQKTTYILKEED